MYIVRFVRFVRCVAGPTQTFVSPWQQRAKRVARVSVGACKERSHDGRGQYPPSPGHFQAAFHPIQPREHTSHLAAPRSLLHEILQHGEPQGKKRVLHEVQTHETRPDRQQQLPVAVATAAVAAVAAPAQTAHDVGKLDGNLDLVPPSTTRRTRVPHARRARQALDFTHRESRGLESVSRLLIGDRRTVPGLPQPDELAARRPRPRPPSPGHQRERRHRRLLRRRDAPDALVALDRTEENLQ